MDNIVDNVLTDPKLTSSGEGVNISTSSLKTASSILGNLRTKFSPPNSSFGGDLGEELSNSKVLYGEE